MRSGSRALRVATGARRDAGRAEVLRGPRQARRLEGTTSPSSDVRSAAELSPHAEPVTTLQRDHLERLSRGYRHAPELLNTPDEHEVPGRSATQIESSPRQQMRMQMRPPLCQHLNPGAHT